MTRKLSPVEETFLEIETMEQLLALHDPEARREMAAKIARLYPDLEIRDLSIVTSGGGSEFRLVVGPRPIPVVLGAPKGPLFLLTLALARKDQEQIIGDLEEEYGEKLAKYGKRCADFWLLAMVGRELWPMVSKAWPYLRRWSIWSSIPVGLSWIMRHLSEWMR